MSHTIDFTPNGVDIIFAGVVHVAEVITANHEFWEHDYAPTFEYVIWDMTAVTQLDLSTAEIHRVADDDSHFAPGHRELIQVIVAPTDLMFGISRMWEAFTETADFASMVVRTRGEAIELLRSRGVSV